MTRAQIVFDHGLQSLSVGRGVCDFDHACSHFVEGAGYGFDEEVILAVEMPVEASFGEAYLLHDGPDAAGVAAMLAKGLRGYRDDVLVALGFVFG